jgi:hypothetical protein
MKSRMSRVVALAVLCAVIASVTPSFAGRAESPAAKGATISGIATDSKGVPIPNAAVQLRDLLANQVVARTTTSSVGEFTFTDVPPGMYIVELVDDDDEIIAASQALQASAGASITGILIATVATVAAAGSTVASAAIIATSAAAAGVAASTAITSSASPSR